MIKVFAIIGAWIIGTGIAALVCGDDTKIESIAYSYTIGFAVALILGLWFWS